MAPTNIQDKSDLPAPVLVDLSEFEEEKEKERLRKEEEDAGIKEKVDDFVGVTTFHGFDNVFNSNDPCWSRFFWSMVMLIMFIIVFLQVKSLVFYFMQSPTTTSVTVVFPKGGLKIPPLTVCTISKLNHTSVKVNYPEMSKTVAEFTTTSFFSAYSTALMDVEYFEREKNTTNANLQQELDRILNGKSLNIYLDESAFDCSSQFVTCWFENGEMGPCCTDGAEKAHVKRYLLHSGPCYEFQAQKIQRLPGPVGGLGFVYWYPNDHILKTAFNAYDEHAVHLYSSVADAMLEKNPTSMPVGMHNHIKLSAVHTKKLLTDELGRSTCKTPTLKYFDEYTFPKCQVECLIDAMLDHCSCTGISTFGKIPQDKLCSPLESIKCFKKLAYNFTNMLVECREEKCPEPCDYWTYSTSLSVGKTFNPVIEDEMKKYWYLPPGDPTKSLIIADIYFDEIQYMEIEEKTAFNIETFVSTVGGALGLWTGASIITWIHLLYFCLVSCATGRYCSRKKDRKKSDVTMVEMGTVENGNLLKAQNSHSV